MPRRYQLALVLVPLLVPNAADAQAIMESGGVNAMSAGLGAGLAASANHGRMVVRSYEAMVSAQQAALAQTRAIEQYMSLGAKYETHKQWDNAEKAYKYVLQVTALRDGPGSSKSVPALKHLVTINEAQSKWTDAIEFQKTVVAFAKKAKALEPGTVLSEQLRLSTLLINKEDYVRAEPVLSDSVAFVRNNPAVPPSQRTATITAYSQVLRKLNKAPQADAIESERFTEPKPKEADRSKSDPNNLEDLLQKPPPDEPEPIAKSQIGDPAGSTPSSIRTQQP
jgi:hypothetical protein